MRVQNVTGNQNNGKTSFKMNTIKLYNTSGLLPKEVLTIRDAILDKKAWQSIGGNDISGYISPKLLFNDESYSIERVCDAINIEVKRFKNITKKGFLGLGKPKTETVELSSVTSTLKNANKDSIISALKENYEELLSTEAEKAQVPKALKDIEEATK